MTNITIWLQCRSYKPSEPLCNAKVCNAPDINNGKLVPSGDTINPDVKVAVECDIGYLLSSSNNKIKCVTNNIFDPFNLPTCNGRCSLDWLIMSIWILKLLLEYVLMQNWSLLMFSFQCVSAIYVDQFCLWWYDVPEWFER